MHGALALALHFHLEVGGSNPSGGTLERWPRGGLPGWQKNSIKWVPTRVAC